jgi:FkbM family methyltransferase
MDFMLNALDAIVNHADKINTISDGEFNPTAIFRTIVGSKTKPLFTGPTHTQDFSDAIQKMVSFPVVQLKDPYDITHVYREAYNNLDKHSTLIVEYRDLYDVPRIHYAENGEDRWIDQNYKLPDTGTYLDIGCAHPQYWSNSYFLRAKGWKGIAVDANPNYKQDWDKSGLGDTFVNAIVSSVPNVHFAINNQNIAISRVEGEGSMPTISATKLLQDRGITKLDFLSIDVEGHECEVINSLDFDIYRPEFIILEHTSAYGRNDSSDDSVYALINYLGYSIVFSNHSNTILKRNH